MKLVLKVNLIFLLLILSVFVQVGFAQSETVAPLIKFNHLTTINGLSNNNVQGIVQDDKGFMWFATLDGLNRFDGYDFKVYRHDPDDPHSLSGNQLRKLYKDRAGNIWVASWSDGLNKFVSETETFIHYQHDPQNPNSLSHNSISGMYEDRAGILWVGTRGGGLNRFDPKTGMFTQYRHDPDDLHTLSHDFVMNIIEDQAGELWVSTYGGLNRLDRKNGTFVRYQHDPDDPRSLSSNASFGMYEDHSGVLWIGTDDGLNRFDRETETFTNYKHDPEDPTSLGCSFVASVREDNSGNFWVFTYGCGLNLFDRETETFTHYRHDPTDPTSMSHNKIFNSYLDRAGNIWMGTYGGGITYLDNSPKRFTHYKHIPGNPTSLSNSVIPTIHEDHTGVLWIGTEGGGLNRFDSKTNTFRHYQNDPEDPHSLSYNTVLIISEDNSGSLWIGTENGLNLFNRDTETFTRYRHNPLDPKSLSGDEVYSIYEDRSGMLWIGTWTEGLNVFDRMTGKFTHYRHDPDDPNSVSHNGIVSIHEDSSNILWVGTYGGGLNRFDRKTRTFRRYQNDPDNPNSLSNNLVFSIYEDQTGALWLATGGGLNKFDRKNERFTHYTTKDGLPNDVVYGILEDRQGNLWMSTNQGLTQFNPRTERFKNYDKRDGIQGNQFNLGAYGQSHDGEMYFGGNNGFSTFYPEQITDNQNIPPVAITNFLLANESVLIDDKSPLQQSILETERLTLSYLDRVISFEFTALNYQSPEKNRFRYKLEGFEDEWTEVDSTRRFATYTNLDPGEYLFRVIGANNDGLWNEEGASIRVTITPPWWETWWAYILYIAIALLLITLFIHYRTYALTKKRNELELQVTQRTEELIMAKEGAEAATRQLEVKQLELETIIDNLPAVFFTKDSEGRYLMINRRYEEAVGVSKEEVIGKTDLAVMPADVAETLMKIDQGVLAGGESITVEEVVPHPDGTLHHYLSTKVPLLDNLGRAITLIGMAADITKLKQLQTDLANSKESADAANQAKSIFLANMSHELRTPLNAVLGMANIGFRDSTDARGRKTFKHILDSSQHLLGVINDILEFSRIEAGKLSTESRPFKLISTVEDTVNMLMESAQATGLKLCANLPSDLPGWVLGDPLRLQQILLNLLSNAIKFTKEGEICVFVSRDADMTHFKLTDTGIGLNEEQISRLFAPFEQADTSTTRKFGGSGLGLTISYNLAQLMGGDIRVESQVNEGSIFTLSLPLAETTAPDIKDSATAEISGSQLKGLRILAAEDVELNRLILEDLLEQEGASVVLAEDGQQAIDCLKEIGIDNIDVILMDLQMPVMGGYEATRHILEIAPELPIIGVTAHALKEERVKCLDAGMVDHVTKPIEADVLISAIRQYVDRVK